jgi:hypothetical protein
MTSPKLSPTGRLPEEDRENQADQKEAVNQDECRARLGSNCVLFPGAANSSLGVLKVTSPNVVQKLKKTKEEIYVVDLEMEKPFVLPRFISDKTFLDKNPLQVAAVDKAAILEMDQRASRDQILEDSTSLLRPLETVLILNEDRGSMTKDLERLREVNAKLEAENMELENEVVDLRGKKENFVAQAKENRELKKVFAKATEEQKKLEKEVRILRSAMAPANDETDNTRGLSSRAKFVARVRKLGDFVLAGMKHG